MASVPGTSASDSPLVAVVMAMWFFFPIVAGQVIPAGELPLRRWLTSWY